MKTIIYTGLTIILFACNTSKQASNSKMTSTKHDTLGIRCYEKPDPGLCRAYMPRYYYDSTEKKCKEFIYGGCQGNVPFETLKECQKSCHCDSVK